MESGLRYLVILFLFPQKREYSFMLSPCSFILDILSLMRAHTVQFFFYIFYFRRMVKAFFLQNSGDFSMLSWMDSLLPKGFPYLFRGHSFFSQLSNLGFKFFPRYFYSF